MLEREAIISELWKRFAGVPGTQFTARNPKDVPSVQNMPCINFFEMPDVVEKVSTRGGRPIYTRRLRIVVESFIIPSTEGASAKELGEYVKEIKKAIYIDGGDLDHKCSLQEKESGQILRPPTGENVIGIGLVLDIVYIEDINKLFA